MLRLNRNGFTEQEVKDALHARYRPRHIKFRYHLLDSDGQFKKELLNVLGGSITLKSLATIKRTAQFQLKNDEDVDWLSDRIQPFVELEMTRITERTTLWSDIGSATWEGLYG